jgi:hypothetical protein
MTQLPLFQAGERLQSWGHCTFTYRRGPVPHTGHRTRGYLGCRYPKTQQERRYQVDISSYGEDLFNLLSSQTAKLERMRQVPNAWDDIPRHAIRRSWKQYRRAQYHGVVVGNR